jgi:hypothetical protein
MKLRITLITSVILAAGATCFAQKPDLTISAIQWRVKPHTVQLVIANVGLSKAAVSTGSYACKSAPNEKGVSYSFGALFTVPELLPNQKWKIVLDCDENKITGAALDTEKKINESDESNNQFSFAEAQQNKGTIKKPGS